MMGSSERRGWRPLAGAMLLAGVCVGVMAQTTPPCTPMPAGGKPARPVVAADFANSGLRGFHLGALPRGALQSWDYTDLKKTGANVVRIGLRLQRCDGCRTYSISEDDLRYADSVVAAGERLGFCTIMAFSPLHPWDKADYWDSDEMQRSLIDGWARVATRFKGNPYVAGFDLINEPAPPRSGDKAGQWLSLAGRMATKVRAIDTGRVIIVDGLAGPRAGPYDSFKPLPMGNVVYSFHFYQPHELTHQRLPGVSGGKQAYPNREINAAWLSQSLEPYRRFARMHKVPMYVGEFGMVRWAPTGSRTRYIRDLVQLFEAEGWSWTYHSFREFHGWDAEMPEGEDEHGRDNPGARGQSGELMVFLRNRLAKHPSK